ncbi:MAG: hypothetical protein ABUL60_21345 [Myxococcales bacterium]
MIHTSQLQAHARFAAVLTLTVAFAACGDDSGTSDPDSAGSGGSSTTGGNPDRAGASSSDAGQAGKGNGGAGTSGAGGNTSTAGSAGTNSQAGSGGSSNGHAGSGGSAQAGTSAESGAGGQGGDVNDGGASGQDAGGGASGQDAGGGAGGQPSVEIGITGTGDDGSLNVDGAVDLATANSGARSCADGGDAVSYSVAALDGSSATLAGAPAAGCLEVGDEVLLINLQGTAAHFGNVGNYETLRVSAVSGSAVSFSKPKLRFYGDAVDDDANLGSERTNQRVMLQRVPNYQNVNVAAAGSLTAGAWDGVKGGVLFFRATGLVSVAGALSMSGKGYAGGIQNTVVNTNGQQGESIRGLGANLGDASQGAGGGGIGDQNGCDSFGASGGGGGYAAPGNDGSAACSGKGGGAYGNASLLSLLMLGSGGGAGGTDNVLSDNPPGGFGGRGGGIVVITAAELEVSGTLMATGGDGEGDLATGCDNGASITSCWDYSGPGGAGSGGSILLDATTSALGSELVTASGGLGGLGDPSGDGGDGADGRIAVHALTLTGATVPIATEN